MVQIIFADDAEDSGHLAWSEENVVSLISRVQEFKNVCYIHLTSNVTVLCTL